MDITTADIEFMGEVVGATVILGPDNAEPILGVTALESVGIAVDPKTQRLKRLPSSIAQIVFVTCTFGHKRRKPSMT